jgi:hypothetical protein
MIKMIKMINILMVGDVSILPFPWVSTQRILAPVQSAPRLM